MRDYVQSTLTNTESKIIRTIQDAGLVVLDDIGSREPTPAQLDALLTLVKVRGTKPFILTGNLDPKGLANMLRDDRVASRICSGTLFHVLGQEQRMAQAQLFEA